MLVKVLMTWPKSLKSARENARMDPLLFFFFLTLTLFYSLCLPLLFFFLNFISNGLVEKFRKSTQTLFTNS